MVNDERDNGNGTEPMPEGEEPPPRGVKTMALVRWVILGASALLAVFMWVAYAKDRLSPGSTDASVQTAKYHCPMHPQIVSDEPGECPICHMALEPISSGRGGAAKPLSTGASTSVADGSTNAGAEYTCPMHPEIRSDEPGRCPVCKMALEPVARSADGGAQHTDHLGARALGRDAGKTAAPSPGSTPPETTAIALALDRVQAIGVRTAVAEEREAARTLRVTAVVMPPEQGAAEVHVRSAGFVEAIQVDQTGIAVKTGQPMLALYSAEILQAQNELLATRGWAGDGGTIAVSARSKLELLGMSPVEIDRMVTRGTPLRAITIASPRGGFVTKKNVVLGSYVTPETTLYEIQDLSKVYVVADVFLPDVADLRMGTEARFVPARDGIRAGTAKVDLIYPVVNPEARTRRIRMQLRNEGERTYSPGEYGTVELATASGRRLAIPRDALVDTGTATYVFVVAGEGHFVPRIVGIGGSDKDNVFVSAGLAPGERVVSGATFLIDAESRLQASIAQTSGTQTTSVPGGGPSCSADFDQRTKPDKWADCVKCEKVHRGMGTMEADCKSAIARPWK